MIVIDVGFVICVCDFGCLLLRCGGMFCLCVCLRGFGFVCCYVLLIVVWFYICDLLLFALRFGVDLVHCRL